MHVGLEEAECDDSHPLLDGDFPEVFVKEGVSIIGRRPSVDHVRWK